MEMFAEVLKAPGGSASSLDPLGTGETLAEGPHHIRFDPVRLMQAHQELWQQQMRLWQSTSRRLAGEPAEPVVKPARGDRRFRHRDWDANPLFDFIKQSYLITSRWLLDSMAAVQGVDPHTAHKLDFAIRQFTDAFAPSNFIWTNPEVLQATLASGGENLQRGLQNFRRDLDRGHGRLKISMCEPNAFEIGRNIANTPGKVVFQNDLIQLLQFAPATPDVYARPVLIISPWINKYYILDLGAEKSFIRWTVERGYTVFVVSWVNPDARFARKGFEDYMTEGVLAAVDAVECATGVREINAVGWCISGTLLAATLAWLAARGDDRIRSATFLTSQVDFSEPGEVRVFVDEQQIEKLDRIMEKQGYLDGQTLFTVFNMLRANDLFWPYYVNNYLLGRDPAPFDVLYWNADNTNLPRRVHLFYLREMYLHNNLVRPGAIELAGIPIDLTRVRVPAYLLATREDHIAPYASCFKAGHHFAGPVRFVLAGSGHIAGVINPPSAGKYQYWVNPDQEGKPGELEAWLAGAVEHRGSWWPDWEAWLAGHSGAKVPAREPGAGGLPAIEDAPGSYVRQRYS